MIEEMEYCCKPVSGSPAISPSFYDCHTRSSQSKVRGSVTGRMGNFRALSLLGLAPRGRFPFRLNPQT